MAWRVLCRACGTDGQPHPKERLRRCFGGLSILRSLRDESLIDQNLSGSVLALISSNCIGRRRITLSTDDAVCSSSAARSPLAASIVTHTLKSIYRTVMSNSCGSIRTPLFVVLKRGTYIMLPSSCLRTDLFSRGLHQTGQAHKCNPNVYHVLISVCDSIREQPFNINKVGVLEFRCDYARLY